MSRLIFFLILLAVVYWVVKRALSPNRRKLADEKGEEMVQDPVCGCFVPKSQAYQASYGGKSLSFCSEECYRKYLASQALPKP